MIYFNPEMQETDRHEIQLQRRGQAQFLLRRSVLSSRILFCSKDAELWKNVYLELISRFQYGTVPTYILLLKQATNFIVTLLYHNYVGHCAFSQLHFV
jgi:hypothetical protein